MSSHEGPEPDQTEAQRKRADRFVTSVIGGFVLGGVSVNLLSDAVAGSPFAWVAPLVFVLVAAVTLIPHGLLRWERHGRRRWALILAVVMTAGYVAAVWWATTSGWSLPVLLVQAILLWAAAVLVCWQTLREGIPIEEAGTGAALLLLGVAALLVGTASLSTDYVVGGVGAALTGLVVLLTGLAVLRGGNTTWVFLGGGTVLLTAVVVGVSGVDATFKWAALPFALTMMLIGVGRLRGFAPSGVTLSRGGAHTLIEIGLALLGVVFILLGVLDLPGMNDASWLTFIVIVLTALALGAIGESGVGHLRGWVVSTLLGATILLFAIVFLLFGLAVLRGGYPLLGAGGILTGLVFPIAGITLLVRRHLAARDMQSNAQEVFRPAVLSWLTTDRTQPKSATEPSTAQPTASQSETDAVTGGQAGSSLPAHDDGSSQNPSPDTSV